MFSERHFLNYFHLLKTTIKKKENNKINSVILHFMIKINENTSPIFTGSRREKNLPVLENYAIVI